LFAYRQRELLIPAVRVTDYDHDGKWLSIQGKPQTGKEKYIQHFFYILFNKQEKVMPPFDYRVAF
jgi:hypothetical protein